MSTLKLAVFDCDGTLLDSLSAICEAMEIAFTGLERDAPSADAVRGIVGLSVPQAIVALAPHETPEIQQRLDQAFRYASLELRKAGAEADGTLYPGTRDALKRLEATGVLMGVATGKARRGLEHTLDVHALRSFFTATQSADDAPSKPHPGMLENCERLTGVLPKDMVMIGDTTFDMLMAKSYGCPAIGVTWGYHPVEALRETGADIVIDSFDALDNALNSLWKQP